MNRARKNSWSSPVRLAIGFGLTLCLLADARAQSLLTTNGNFFAWPDTEAPGLPGVYFGGNVDFSTLAEDGSLAFRADLYGAGTSGINSRALFKGSSAATLQMLARWNDDAPGLPGLSLMNIAGTNGIGSNVIISPSSSYTLWSSPLSGPGVSTTNDSALYESSPGGHLLIAREGAPAPGTAGAIYVGNYIDASYQFTKINRHGTVVFYSQLAGGDVVVNVNDYAMFTGTPGAVSLLLRQGDTVLPGPVKAAGLGYTVQLDNNGRVFYNLPLTGAGVTSANNDSLWIYTPGSGSQLLVREGDPAPGTLGATFANTGQGVGFPGVSVTSLTRSGRYEFTTDLTGGDVTPGINDRALYAGLIGGGPTMIARRGQPAPGTDATFDGFSPFYSLINDAGDVAFQATLTGGSSNPTNNSGIWIWRSGMLSLVVRSGGPVPVVPPGLETPGIAPGTTFDTFIGWNMVFNDVGQIVVFAGLMGGDVLPGIDHNAVLAWDPTKGLFLAARAAEDIEFAPGNVRTAQQLGRGLQRSGKERDARADGPSHRRDRRRDARSELLPVDGLRYRLRWGRQGRSRNEGRCVQWRDAAGRVRRKRHRLQRREPRRLCRLLPGCRWGFLRRPRVERLRRRGAAGRVCHQAHGLRRHEGRRPSGSSGRALRRSR
jgi:hypothetical protein